MGGLILVFAIVFAVQRWRASLPPRATPQERELAEALRDRLTRQLGEQVLDLDKARASAAEEEAAGRQATALDLLSKAATSGDLEAELSLAVQALRAPVPVVISLDEARALVAVLAEDAPGARLVPAALGWSKISQDDPMGALRALDQDSGTLEGRWARLRALQMLEQDPSGEAEEILKLAPGHEDACEVSARAALARGDLSQTRTRVRDCLAAGARGPALRRMLGDAASAAGRYEEAAAAYADAGALLHAAAIISQDGLPDPKGLVEAAISDPAPPSALGAVWVRLLRGDTAGAAEAGARLKASGMPGPEAALAVAASRLAAGDAAGALAETEGAGSAEALVLRARARAALGDDTGAREDFQAAVAAAPTNQGVHRERLAFLAERLPDELPEALAALVSIDPITLELSRAARRRDAPAAVLMPSPWPELRGGQATLLAAVQAPQTLKEQDLATAPPGSSARLALHLAWGERALGAMDLARAHARAALEALPGDPGALAVVGELAVEAGDQPEIARWLDQTAPPAEAVPGAVVDPGAEPAADPAAPGASALAWARARALAAAGQRDAARQALLDAARANPEQTGLWASLLALDESASVPGPGPDRLTGDLGSTR